MCPALLLANGNVEYDGGSHVYSGDSEGGSRVYSGDSEGKDVGSGDGIQYGINATLTCNEGFIMLGDVTRVCEGSGSTGVWSGSSTMCSGL